MRRGKVTDDYSSVALPRDCLRTLQRRRRARRFFRRAARPRLAATSPAAYAAAARFFLSITGAERRRSTVRELARSAGLAMAAPSVERGGRNAARGDIGRNFRSSESLLRSIFSRSRRVRHHPPRTLQWRDFLPIAGANRRSVAGGTQRRGRCRPKFSIA